MKGNVCSSACDNAVSNYALPGKQWRRTLVQMPGFGILEVLLALIIVAVVSLLGVSATRSFIAKQQMTSAYQSFVSDIRFARSEAKLRSEVVRICESSDQTTCTGNTNWNSWITYQDTNNDNARQADETIINVTQVPTTSLSTTSGYSSLLIDAKGTISRAGTMVITHPELPNLAYCIVTTNRGRLRYYLDHSGATCM